MSTIVAPRAFPRQRKARRAFDSFKVSNVGLRAGGAALAAALAAFNARWQPLLHDAGVQEGDFVWTVLSLNDVMADETTFVMNSLPPYTLYTFI